MKTKHLRGIGWFGPLSLLFVILLASPLMPSTNDSAILAALPANASTEYQNISSLSSSASAPPSADYEILSSSDSATTIRSSSGNSITIDSDAFSRLQNNETVRIIAKSSRRIDLSNFTSSQPLLLLKKPPLPAKIAVFEAGNSSIAQLADLGFENIYPDSQMKASLSDTVPLIGAGRAQSELNYTGEGITVCLLDTGVDFSNPQLGGKAAGGYDFVNGDENASDDDPQQHGTLMAEIIHAIAPNALILPLKVLSSNATGYSSDILAGIDYCTQLASGGTVKIISMSFGEGEFSGYCNSEPVAQATNDAVAAGLLAVASAGNNGSSSITSPACAENATAVSASTKSDGIWPGSNMNGMVDLLAPGEAVVVGGATLSGTSASAAHVSGAAALLLQSNSSLTPAEAEQRLKTTGKLIEFSGANYTRIDIYNAIIGNFTGEPTNQGVNESNQTGGNPDLAVYSAQATNVSSCGTLGSANTTYTLNQSVSINGSTCFTVGAANITLDCNGYSISGNNSSATYGVTSVQPNTTVQNCNISGFQYGIYFNGASSGTIFGTNASSSYSDGIGIYLLSSTSTAITSSIGTSSATPGYGIRLSSSSSNSIAGSTGNATALNGTGISLAGSSSSNNLTNSTGSSSSGASAIQLDGSSSSNLLLNNTASASGTSVVISVASNSNTFTNNTLVSASGTLLSLSGSASGNIFYYNNFTNTSGLYVNDSSSGTNYLNTTNGSGMPHGNYWFNVYSSQSLKVYDDNLDGWADSARAGYSYPYGENTSGGKITGNAKDYGPAVISYRITYQTQASFNGSAAIYFANGTTANITASGTFASTPRITIIDSHGALQANATMNGSASPYYYAYVINGSNGWYNTTISENDGSAPQSFPVLFYASAPWQGNFTDASGASFTYRAQLNVTEPNKVFRARQPVDFFFNTLNGSASNSVRLALVQNGSLIEIPYQLYNISYANFSSNNTSIRMVGANVVFVDSFLLNQTKTYYSYYAVASRTAPNYASDLRVSNQSGNYAFDTAGFTVNVTESLGATVTGMKSKYSDLELAGIQPPMASPVMFFADEAGQQTSLSFSAVNSTSLSSSLSNGTVFSKYSAGASASLFSYTLNYSFYAGLPYFVLETNVTPIEFSVFYHDANLSLSKGKFDTVTYQNNTSVSQNLSISGAGLSYSNLSNISSLQFTRAAVKNGLGLIFAESSSSANISPLLSIADTDGDYQLDRLFFNGSANASSWFYTKAAYLISDPSNASTLNDTILALANPMAYSLGSDERFPASPPSYTQANVSPFQPNDTNDITCFSYWQSAALDLANYTATFASADYSANVSQNLSGTASWVNLTANSSVLQAGSASCAIAVTDSDGNTNSTTINFTIADKKPPVFASVSNSPSDNASLDPNTTITVSANLTEFTNMSSALLQYNSSSNSTLANATMSLASNGSHWFYYTANFTPLSEGNYSYRIFANDTSGNSNYSNFTTLSVFYDLTWTRSPALFNSTGATTSTNATVGNLTFNNTGDRPLAFTIHSDKDLSIYYNGTLETLSGYAVSLPVNGTAVIPINVTARATPATDQVTLTITSQNSSATPLAYNTTFTFVSCGSGPCLALTIGTSPASVTQGDTGVSLSGTVTNIGTGANSTSTNTVLTWTLPSDWAITTGSASKAAGTLLSGESSTHPITVSIPSTASNGSKNITLSATNSQNGSTSTTASVLVLAAGSVTPAPAPAPSPSSTPAGGGSGGGAGGAGGNFTAAKPPKKVEKPLTFEQKSQLFSTLASYELVRGRDSTFILNITNPLEQDLDNVSVGVSGYLFQYLGLQPSHIDTIPAGGSREVQISIVAPKYFNEGAFTLYFNITGTSTEETEDSIITTNIRETRTVELKILEMSRDDAFRLLSEANGIRQQMEDAGVYHGAVVSTFNDINSSYSSDKFGTLRPQVGKMRDLRAAAFTAQERLGILKQKLDSASSEDMKTPQTMRLYSLASSAFERGDYANAMLRISDAELTYALETAQGFSLYSFVRKYAVQIAAGMMMLGIVSLIIYVDLRFWTMDSELSQLSNEENIVLGLIKEAQREYFEHGKMSTDEYYASAEQYDARLGKIVQRKVELETIKENYFSLRGRGGRLLAEKKRLETLIAELQSAYLEQGKMETRVYENRMKSYVSRLSEIEESMAVAEAQATLRKSHGLLDIFRKQPPEDGALAEAQENTKKPGGLLGMFGKKPPEGGKAA